MHATIVVPVPKKADQLQRWQSQLGRQTTARHRQSRGARTGFEPGTQCPLLTAAAACTHSTQAQTSDPKTPRARHGCCRFCACWLYVPDRRESRELKLLHQPRGKPAGSQHSQLFSKFLSKVCKSRRES